MRFRVDLLRACAESCPRGCRDQNRRDIRGCPAVWIVRCFGVREMGAADCVLGNNSLATDSHVSVILPYLMSLVSLGRAPAYSVL